MAQELKAALSEFVGFAQTLRGDEKSEAQAFLDHFFRALGHRGVIGGARHSSFGFARLCPGGRSRAHAAFYSATASGVVVKFFSSNCRTTNLLECRQRLNCSRINRRHEPMLIGSMHQTEPRMIGIDLFFRFRHTLFATTSRGLA